uniref:Ig-like domain-containing protein n=1 Tax=Pundamilia nyererei TaxID=303518 RepID=A0A3B4FIH2_9CICH
WGNLHNRWLTKYFFAPLYVSLTGDSRWSGRNVTLTCRARKNIQTVEWRRADLGDEYVFLYRDGRKTLNRVDLQDRQMKDGDVSLILKDVTTADSGTYECRVFMGGKERRKRAHLKTDPISSIYLTGSQFVHETFGLFFFYKTYKTCKLQTCPVSTVSVAVSS